MSRIMIVDDDDAIRASLRRTLERHGHVVSEDADGHSALRHFAGNPTDLVISDVYMPDMDGIEFLMRVRELFPDARIIMMSGGGQIGKTSVLAAAAKLGAERVFEKPFELDEVLEAVRSLLAGEAGA